MWTYEHSVDTTAAPAAVWACYATTAVWPEWDKEVQELTLDGDLAAGTGGTLTLHGLPPTPIAVTEAAAGTGFTCETRVPDGTILRFSLGWPNSPAARGSPSGWRSTVRPPRSPGSAPR